MDTKYLKNFFIYCLTALVSVGLMAYIGYHVFHTLTTEVETQPARVTTTAEVVDADLYIFRDEIPLDSVSSAGTLIPAVGDGTRVGVGDVVSRRYEVFAPDILARIEEIDMQLSVIGRMQESRLSVRDTAGVDSEIYALLREISAAGASGDATSVLPLRASLTAALNRRDLLTGSLSGSEAAKVRLQSEKDALKARLWTCREEIRTTGSGYYFAECDGYRPNCTSDRSRRRRRVYDDQYTFRHADRSKNTETNFS